LIDGILNVYKESGYTSFDVVAKLRGILKQKKIGHTGTLDPMAEGVLPVCLGKATKLVDMLTVSSKEYSAVMMLGITTDTEDITGKILSKNSIDESITSESILNVFESFIGKYNQIPPMYSAIKKDGKKLYEYARAGIEIEREARTVEIFSIDDIQIDIPYVSFKVHCSKGTYIRSLCRDIGDKLGCGATLKELKRNDVHGFNISDSLKLSEIEQLVKENSLSDKVLPIDSLLMNYKKVFVKESYSTYINNGNKLLAKYLIFEDNPDEILDNQIFRVYLNDEFLALYQYIMSEKVFKPYKMFLG